MLNGRGDFWALGVLYSTSCTDNQTIFILTAQSFVIHCEKSKKENESGKIFSTNHELRMTSWPLFISNPRFIIHDSTFINHHFCSLRYFLVAFWCCSCNFLCVWLCVGWARICSGDVSFTSYLLLMFKDVKNISFGRLSLPNELSYRLQLRLILKSSVCSWKWAQVDVSRSICLGAMSF